MKTNAVTRRLTLCSHSPPKAVPRHWRPCLAAALLALAAPVATEASTVWSGPRIAKSNVDEPDHLTALVALTRGNTQGLYNSLQEAGFTHFLSPIDTDWADGTTANTNLAYADWNTWAKTTHGGPQNTVGINAVVHLKTDDVYIDIKFLSWQIGGGYTYERSTPANVPPGVTITNPADNATFGNTDTVILQASASDADGNVTNVQLFNGAVLLRSFSTGPYSFSGTSISGLFALGTNTLTAVATDNLGATTTSAPIHVIIARYLPAIPDGDITILLQPIATNMAAPDYAISPPGDTNRLFVVEQNGLLRIIQNGTLLPGAALDITTRVQPPLVPANPNDERGFLGLAFHPGFTNPASPGYQTLYTYNSETIPAATTPTYPAPNGATNTYKNVVNEWKISSTNANVVDPASRRELVSFGKNAANHNGGTIAFGSDGYLYLGLGDGGNANDAGASHIEPGGNAQNLTTPLGKMLRFDPLNPTLTPISSDPVSSNGQYRIPANNPFQGPGQVPEIYAYGLRNPYRFSFDRANGDLIQADVGQNNIEEIDRIVSGGNYGWAIKEGDFLFNRTNSPSGNAGTIGAPPGNRSTRSPAGLIDPIAGTLATLEYDHNEGISITGGFVYRGAAIPELFGKYIFGDLALKTTPVRANGRLFYADLQTGLIKAFPWAQFSGAAILPNGLTVHGFGEDAAGELYALVTNTSAAGTGGIVYKLISRPLLSVPAMTGANLTLSWTSLSGGTYRVQYSADLLTTNWNSLGGDVTAGGSTTSKTDGPPSTTTNRFYRVLVLP